MSSSFRWPPYPKICCQADGYSDTVSSVLGLRLTPLFNLFHTSVGQKAPHSCHTHTHTIPRVLGQDSKTCCFKSGLVCKIRFWLFQNSYCNCWSKTQFLLPALRMTPMFVAQDPDPCSFKLVFGESTSQLIFCPKNLPRFPRSWPWVK